MESQERLALFSERELLEVQDVPSLLAARAIQLSILNVAEERVHLINDVLGGYGHVE